MREVLARLPVTAAPELLVGTRHPDDAAVYLTPGGDRLVQTVDLIAPIVNDPRTFGKIAAANSISDVYAMGGRPLTALNVVCFPAQKLPMEVLEEILAGAIDVATEAGCLVVGGHSVADAELKYGLSVAGIIEAGDPVLSIDRSEVGDVLVLTKPLGTGVLNQALRKDALEESSPHFQAAVRSMVALNRQPALAAKAAGAHAATDITGFGLLGHATQFALASEVTFELERSAVPVFEGVRGLLDAGFLPGRCKDNTLAYQDQVAGLRAGPDAAILSDPQTSGGLLISLPESGLTTLLEVLRDWPHGAVVIGRVCPRGDHALVIL